MTELAHAGIRVSNRATQSVAVDFSWPSLFRGIFPENTAANVATFSRTKLRAAEYLLSGYSDNPSGGALVNLLRSPVGPQVIDALAGDAPWRAFERRLLQIAELENDLKKLEQQKRELALALVGGG